MGRATLLLAAVAAALPAAAQPQFFPPSEMMNIGVYYYPEAWPREQWPRDLANIKKLGLEFVHMAEFSWGFLEPEEGRFDFEWLERNVKLASAQGLKVVLCTPSAAPPVWLVQKHPEVLMLDSTGHRMQHGSREHACWSVPKYREYVGRIVTELARRFGNDPRVWGWQIDNELSHYGKRYCYCDFCQTKFRAWLKQKYGTVERLNQDWGNAFWSEMYRSFDQVRMPNDDELVAGANPHALLDLNRWFAAEAAGFIRFQAGLLRQHGRKQWVTTNFMAMHSEVYPPLSTKDLDILTWTVYPVHGNKNEGPLGFRLGDGAALGFMHDFLRPQNGNQGIMELQPGQVNWGEVNPRPYPGAIRMWILHAFGAGAKLVCTYRYRQPLFGGELYHNGLVETGGVTPSIGGLEYAQAMREIRQLRELYRPGAQMPAAWSARRSAVLYNVENRWDLDNHKQTNRWDTMGHVLKYYQALKSAGAPVDAITEDKDFSAYPFLAVPAYQLVDRALVERLTAYARNGGHLILSCRTGQKDRRGHLWEAKWAEPIHDLIGASIPAYDLLPAPLENVVQAADKRYAWGVWGEMLEPRDGTTPLATYAGDFYRGKAAAVTRKLGKGSVTYVGVESLAGDLERDLVRGVFGRAGVAAENFDPQLQVNWHDGFFVAANFSSKKQTVPIPAGARVVIGSGELDPAGVTVWMAK
jgi:beta-galactosidase